MKKISSLLMAMMALVLVACKEPAPEGTVEKAEGLRKIGRAHV